MATKIDEDIMFPEIVNNAQVRHPVYGVGRVVMRTGADEKSKAIVKFKEEGEKKLALRFAKLKADKVEEEPEAKPEETEGGQA